MSKELDEMRPVELVEAIVRFATEHDLDCEEGVGSDRCIPCLAAAALKLLK